MKVCTSALHHIIEVLSDVKRNQEPVTSLFKSLKQRFTPVVPSQSGKRKSTEQPAVSLIIKSS